VRRYTFVRRELRALRLIASILGEGAMTVFHMVRFPVQRRAERARMRAIILGRVAPLLIACALFLPTGCSSWSTQPTFQRGIDDLEWSIYTLGDMGDAEESLKDDLANLANPDAGAMKETFELWGW
jgi:hypothetical protein